MAFDEIEPPASEFWHMAAMIAHTVYRMAGGKKLKLKDFMPKLTIGGRVKQDVQAQIAAFKSAVKGSGKADGG